MMRYIPNSDADCACMLQQIGLESLDDLFAHIPEALRLRAPLRVPGSLSEPELIERLTGLAAENTHADPALSFLGAGAYAHHIPSAVDALLSRFEFATAYTPYQAEICQGTLQAVFEYQTLICQLTGLDVSNASLYDGSTAVAEAALMALRVVRGASRVAVARTLNPLYRQVLRTYLRNLGTEVVEVPFGPTGVLEAEAAAQALASPAACLIVQQPNFFGRLEPLGELAEAAHRAGALMVTAVAEPVSLGLLRPPGELGSDLVAGHGSSFGNSLNYGGPGFGFLACREKLVRNLPGRLVGQTVDNQGRTGYVLTLTTREQHIRRARATSNICTSQALNALAGTIFLALMGEGGARELARQNALKAHYARRRLAAIPGVEDLFPGPAFNEFALWLPLDPASVGRRLLDAGIVGGLNLEPEYPELAGGMLFCVTEVNRRQGIDLLAQKLEETLAR